LGRFRGEKEGIKEMVAKLIHQERAPVDKKSNENGRGKNTTSDVPVFLKEKERPGARVLRRGTRKMQNDSRPSTHK